MRTIIYLGEQKNFSGVRLGIHLAQVLGTRGTEAVLVGKKSVLPDYTPFETAEVAAAATVKSFTNVLKKTKAEKVISFVGLPICEAAVGFKIPFIYVEPENFKEDKPVKNKKAFLQKAARVVVLGESSKKLNTRVYSANAVRVASPAIWVEHYNYDKPSCFKRENNIVAFGDCTRDGGFDVLLQTWARLSPAHTSWHLTIVGNGPQKSALKKFIQKHKLESATELLGAETDIYSLLRNADIYVSPSRAAQDISIILDAMASKLPVLATDVPGVDSLITNGVNGVIVNAGEEEPLTIALDELMVDWGKRVGFAVRAWEMKDRYPFEAFTAFFEEK